MNVWTMVSEDCEQHVPLRDEALQGCPVCLLQDGEALREATDLLRWWSDDTELANSDAAVEVLDKHIREFLAAHSATPEPTP